MANLFPYTFAHPNYFWLLLAVPFLLYWFYYKKDSFFPAFNIPQHGGVLTQSPSLKVRMMPLLPLLKIMAFVFLVFALARPQSSLSEKEISTQGIDIVLSLDISGSMLARDFEPDRLEAAKKVAMKFIKDRPNDRIGLVVFSGESFTQCPITIDHQVLLNLFKDIHSGMVEDGTAIGMGLATAVARLKESKSKTKVIILMTDGVNNMGYIDPYTSIKIAKAFGVRVYTIGIGKNGNAPYPVKDQNGKTYYQSFPVQIDEPLLRKIAQETGGNYFRATGNSSLKNIYDNIDKLEKSKIKISNYHRKSERFHLFAFLALFCLLAEFVLSRTYLKTILT
ncbi:MAG: VWA domain-containing protein [Chitinophagales bacterium]